MPRKYITGYVNLGKYYLTEIPEFIKDVEIRGDLIVNHNNLTSLKNSPRIVMGSFNCHNSKVHTLLGAPDSVHNFFCDKNKIESLEGAPSEVTGTFICSNNPSLKTLKGAPTKIGNSFYCNYSGLKSLEFGPTVVGSPKNKDEDNEYTCSRNKLKNLIGSPKVIYGDFYCDENELESLEGIPEMIYGSLDISGNRGTKFTKADILEVCDVKKRIFL